MRAQADELERQRRLAVGVGYRMLGSVAEAEDVAQEALLRLHAADDVRNPDAFLTTVATRLSLDVLRSARVRREASVGEWLPEPLVEDAGAQRVEDDETVSLAFLALLERLAPEERAVLVLREAFEWDYDEIAAVLDKRPDACRQLLSRARRRVDDDRPRFEPDAAQRDALAARFLVAARGGDVDGLVALLAPDAVLVGDGGGKALSISRPLVGAPAIAKALAGFAARGERHGVTFAPARVNGQPGMRAVAADGRLVSVFSVDVLDGRVVRLHSILNPDKLGHLGPLSEMALRGSRGGG
ncbi:MAG TPA: RNA polymerase sigma factor SigJ [Conexibacter sp.]|nr:RNA polymerase sigma factor SigJ [Conexibacter sp.]